MAPPLDPGQVAHDHFPKDGKRYWVKWIDRVSRSGGATATPTVDVWLCELPDTLSVHSLPDITDIAKTAGGAWFPVHVSSLAGLPLGSIVRDGKLEGDVGLQHARFKFGGLFKHELNACKGLNPMPKPPWWTMPWNVVPSTRYRLDFSWSPFCEIFYDDTQQLVIPCSEIFRALCAPDSRLAGCLLSGQWIAIRNRLVNENWCEQETDRWQIGLRTGLTGQSALPVAAYEWSQRGRQVVSLLNVDAPAHGSGRTPLKAQIPYEFASVDFACEGMWLSEREGIRRFLALRVTGTSFPDGLRSLPPVIEYRLDMTLPPELPSF